MRRRAWRVAAGVLVLGLVLTAIATQGVRVGVNRDRTLQFRVQVEDARTAIERRLATYAETLYGLRSLFASKGSVSRTDFARFVDSSDILRRFPGLQAVEFSAAVGRATLPSFAAQVRADQSLTPGGYPDFVVHPDSTGSQPVVVDYVEPMTGNEPAFGFDLTSESSRRDAVDEARDTGDLVATAPIRLVQEHGQQSGFLLFLAVYDGSPATAPARRRHFLGVVTEVFRVDDMLRSSLGAAMASAVRVRAIYDVGRTEASPRPLSTAAVVTGDRLAFRHLSSTNATIDLNVGSRRWRILATPGPGAVNGRDALAPLTIAILGLVLTALVAGLVLSLATSRVRAELLAAEMTADLRRHEQQLRHSNERLEASNRAMREFVAVASHDMRSPLAAIIGFAQTLRRSWDNGDDRLRRNGLEVIERRAEQLSRLVGDLLTTSEIDADAVAPHPDHVDLRAAVDRCLADVPGDRDGFTVSVPATAGAATVDVEHLRRMLANLVENALKYGAAPFEIAVTDDADDVVIRVRDHGPGVPAPFVPRLFDKFARAEIGLVPAAMQGTGLGLAIVRGLARANLGDAWYEPASPGACFAVRLPRHDRTTD